jgi:hypothetical protein
MAQKRICRRVLKTSPKSKSARISQLSIAFLEGEQTLWFLALSFLVLSHLYVRGLQRSISLGAMIVSSQVHGEKPWRIFGLRFE